MNMNTFVICFALIATGPAGATGLYDFGCCPNDDCQSVDPATISQVAGGYLVRDLQEVVAADDPRIRISRDGRYHLCTRSRATPDLSEAQVAGLTGQRRVKCLYIPAMF